ncbi:MAG: hypothetical protein ACYC5O_17845 [Anaerolineae bacterium]
MYMIMLVLDDEERLGEVLDTWEAAGATGATVVESTGVHRIRACRGRVHARFDFSHIADECEQGHVTLFAIVKDEEVARACLRVTERVIGDLDGPNTGVLAAWPLALVKGVPGAAT